MTLYITPSYALPPEFLRVSAMWLFADIARRPLSFSSVTSLNPRWIASVAPVAANAARVSLSGIDEARPGVRQKRIWEDKAGERRAILARFEPGATLPPHRHVGDELIFLVEGANADESGIVASGNMNYRPNGCVHSVTTKNGATVLAVVWGRTEPI